MTAVSERSERTINSGRERFAERGAHVAGSGSRSEAMPNEHSERLERWIRRLDRTAEAIEWFVRRVLLVVLLVLAGVGVAWYMALEYRTPDPWSGPDATTDAFGWQVWAAGAAAITGLLGLFLIPYIGVALIAPVAVASWVLARFRADDPVRRTVTGLPDRARTASSRAFARPTYTRSDLVAPLRAAIRRPATWVLVAGGLVLAVILAVGVSTVLPPAGTDRPPLTADEDAAAVQRLRSVALEIHAAIGSPPVHEALRVVERPLCVPGEGASGRSRSGFAYLVTRPGTDPVGRMPGWAADLRAAGWAVTYPIETRSRPITDMLEATRAGIALALDARYPPDLSVEVRGLC
jgi:hypothetical protein